MMQGGNAAMWRDRCEALELEIERLRNALRDIEDLATKNPVGVALSMQQMARIALWK